MRSAFPGDCCTCTWRMRMRMRIHSFNGNGSGSFIVLSWLEDAKHRADDTSDIARGCGCIQSQWYWLTDETRRGTERGRRGTNDIGRHECTPIVPRRRQSSSDSSPWASPPGVVRCLW